MEEEKEIVALAGGCFWCIEAVFSQAMGVLSVQSGYTGGQRENPTYEEVCSGKTGHAEAVKVTFDPNQIAFEEILRLFFAAHDPTSLNRQGNDVGTQYRSAIFYTTETQKRKIEHYIKVINQSLPKPYVTEVAPLQQFYPAEAYHDDYYARNKTAPYCQIVIAPKLEKMKETFPKRMKSD